MASRFFTLFTFFAALCMLLLASASPIVPDAGALEPRGCYARFGGCKFVDPNATETSDLLPSATVESAPTSTAIPDADGSPNAAADPTDDADVTETTLAAPTLATPALAAAQSNGAGRLVGQAPMVPLLALSAIASVVLFGL